MEPNTIRLHVTERQANLIIELLKQEARECESYDDMYGSSESLDLIDNIRHDIAYSGLLVTH